MTQECLISTMNLSHLPIEILCPIMSYIHYLDIAKLWFVGCKALHAKFARGGVAVLSVHFSSNLRTFLWPSLFLQLSHLTHLEIHNQYYDNKIRITTAMLASASHTLKSLHVNALGAFTAFLDVASRDPSAFLALETLQMSVSRKEAANRDVVTRWPENLSTLILDVVERRHLNLNLSILPPHLTRLRGNWNKVVNPKQGAFPASLTALEIQLSRLTCDPIPLLPPGLKEMTMNVLGSGDPDDADPRTTKSDFESWAHRSLGALPCGVVLLDWPLPAFNEEEVRSLPPNLTELRRTVVAPNLLHLLPRTLQHIDACASGYETVVKADMVDGLPTGLGRLQVEAGALPLLKPSALLSVSVLGSCEHLENELKALNAQTLSQAIVELSLEVAQNWPWKCAPTNLTSLILAEGPFTANEIGLFPKTLKKLEFAVGVWTHEVEAWKRLPPNLEELNIHKVNVLETDSSRWIPRTLTALSISSCETQPQPIAWFEGLPNKLRSLEAPLHFTSIPAYDTDDSWRIHLPEGLEILTLWSDWPLTAPAASKVMQNMLCSLPRDLQALDLSHSGEGEEDDVPYQVSDLLKLPKRLTALVLPRGRILLDNPVRSIFPLSLTSLSIGYEAYPPCP